MKVGANLRLTDEQVSEVQILAATHRYCCEEGAEGECPTCRAMHGAYYLALEVFAWRAGLGSESYLRISRCRPRSIAEGWRQDGPPA
jgi:hypothetical protein